MTTSQYRFSGTTEPGAEVVAAGRYPVDVGADGTWSIVLVLNRGSNVATFTATDGAGNTTEVRHVAYFNECADDPESLIPAGADDLTSIVGDLDGDGASDQVSTYMKGGRWYLGVELAYGWESTLDIGPWTGLYSGDVVEMKRIVDFADPLALAVTGGTAVGPAYGWFGLDGCRLTPILDEDGTLPVLWDGVGGQHGVMTCQADGVTQIVLSPGNNEGFKVTLDRDHYQYQTATHTWDHVHFPTVTLGFGEEVYQAAIESYEYCADDS